MLKRKHLIYAAAGLCVALLFIVVIGKLGTGGGDAVPQAPAEQMLAGIASLPEPGFSPAEGEHEPGEGPVAAGPEDAAQAQPPEAGQEEPVEDQPVQQEAGQPAPAPDSQQAPEKTASATQKKTEVTAITAKPTLEGGSVVPAQAQPVGEDYFDDAAFIGNSLVDGFRLFSGVKSMDYYAANSMTIFGIGDYITEMSSIQYGKIYMLLGINELTYNLDKLMTAYGKALDRLMDDHPGALIYVMGVSPVSAAKDASSTSFNMANVYKFNERLLQLVEDKGCYYIDLCDALAGEDGFLPSDVTTDGIHFKADEYKVWRDYLYSHYVPTEEPSKEPAKEPSAPAASEPAPETAPESTPETPPAPVEAPAQSPAQPPEGDLRVLVTYFSATSHTEAVAQIIADALGADLFTLTPAVPYTSTDLDWSQPDSRVSREHEDAALRQVALTADRVENWADYDVVFLGYPIWWGEAAWPVEGFVKANDFSGKIVIPFCTSASSGLGDSGTLLAGMAGSGDWRSGRRFGESTPQSEILSWLNGLEFSPTP